jgi:hypothetical protein
VKCLCLWKIKDRRSGSRVLNNGHDNMLWQGEYLYG